MQSEASDQICADLSNSNALIESILTEAADGLVVRFSVTDKKFGKLGIYVDGIRVDSLQLNSKWSWQYLWKDGNPNNTNFRTTQGCRIGYFFKAV